MDCLKDEEVALATPGPTKHEAADELEVLWNTAIERLEEADVVVFVGFRFPPSDARARKRLLSALATNHYGKGHHLSLHVVLGQDRSDPRIVRLERLLTDTMDRGARMAASLPPSDINTTIIRPAHVRTYRLTVHPLFAEDFFTVRDPRELGER